MPSGAQSAEKLLAGAQKPVDPCPTKAFPKQQGKAYPPRSRPGHQAPAGVTEKKDASFTQRNSRGDLAQLFPPDMGVPRECAPGRAEGARGDPGWVEQPGRGSTIWAALRPFLTFQREPAARVVLSRARPHHPGHSSGQCGHPGGSFAWKLYPGEGEIDDTGAGDPRQLPRAWRVPPQKGWRERRDPGKGSCSLLVQREARGGTGGMGWAGRPRSPGSRAQGGKVWCESGPAAPRLGALGRGLGVRQRAGEGGWGRERGRPESPPVVTPSAGIWAREHLLVLSPKAWSGALSCDWPTGRPSRVAEIRADWATAATFSSHPRRCPSLDRPREGPALSL